MAVSERTYDPLEGKHTVKERMRWRMQETLDELFSGWIGRSRRGEMCRYIVLTEVDFCKERIVVSALTTRSETMSDIKQTETAIHFSRLLVEVGAELRVRHPAALFFTRTAWIGLGLHRQGLESVGQVTVACCMAR